MGAASNISTYRAEYNQTLLKQSAPDPKGSYHSKARCCTRDCAANVAVYIKKHVAQVLHAVQCPLPSGNTQASACQPLQAYKHLASVMLAPQRNRSQAVQAVCHTGVPHQQRSSLGPSSEPDQTACVPTARCPRPTWKQNPHRTP